MKTRTTGARAPPASSTCTSSSPRSPAARSAISLKRPSTEPSSPKPANLPKQPSAQKKKWAKTHWTPPPRSEQEANYKVTVGAWQAGGKAGRGKRERAEKGKGKGEVKGDEKGRLRRARAS